MISRNRPTSKPVHARPSPGEVKLEIVQLPIYRVHYQKLEGFIHRVFGFEFDFLLAAGVAQGECPEYRVDGSLATSEWQRRAGDLRNGRRTRSVDLILNVLAADGYIPKGRYTVSTHEPPNTTVQYTQLLRHTGNPESPECMKFKTDRKNDLVFTQRAAILDTAWLAQTEASK